MNILCWVILLGVIFYFALACIIRLERRKREIDRLHRWLAYEIEDVIDDVSTSDEDIDDLLSLMQFADQYFKEIGAGVRLPSLVDQLQSEIVYANEEYL